MEEASGVRIRKRSDSRRKSGEAQKKRRKTSQDDEDDKKTTKRNDEKRSVGINGLEKRRQTKGIHYEIARHCTWVLVPLGELFEEEKMSWKTFQVYIHRKCRWRRIPRRGQADRWKKGRRSNKGDLVVFLKNRGIYVEECDPPSSSFSKSPRERRKKKRRQKKVLQKTTKEKIQVVAHAR